MHDDGFLLAGEDKERVIYTVACIAAISSGVAAALGATTAGEELVFLWTVGTFFCLLHNRTLSLSHSRSGVTDETRFDTTSGLAWNRCLLQKFLSFFFCPPAPGLEGEAALCRPRGQLLLHLVGEATREILISS